MPFGDSWLRAPQRTDYRLLSLFVLCELVEKSSVFSNQSFPKPQKRIVCNEIPVTISEQIQCFYVNGTVANGGKKTAQIAETLVFEYIRLSWQGSSGQPQQCPNTFEVLARFMYALIQVVFSLQLRNRAADLFGCDTPQRI